MYLKRVSELDQITDVRNNQRKQHDELRRQRLDEFMSGFSVITTRLKEMYQMITLGGDAELELVDSLDPFSEGIVFRSLLHLVVVVVAVIAVVVVVLVVVVEMYQMITLGGSASSVVLVYLPVFAGTHWVTSLSLRQ